MSCIFRVVEDAVVLYVSRPRPILVVVGLTNALACSGCSLGDIPFLYITPGSIYMSTQQIS